MYVAIIASTTHTGFDVMILECPPALRYSRSARSPARNFSVLIKRMRTQCVPGSFLESLGTRLLRNKEEWLWYKFSIICLAAFRVVLLLFCSCAASTQLTTGLCHIRCHKELLWNELNMLSRCIQSCVVAIYF